MPSASVSRALGLSTGIRLSLPRVRGQSTCRSESVLLVDGGVDQALDCAETSADVRACDGDQDAKTFGSPELSESEFAL